MEIVSPDWQWARPLSRRVGAPCGYFVHHSAGALTASAIHAGHRAKGYSGIGYMYVVEPTRVVRGRPEWAFGAHTLGWNHGIGICFAGNFDVTRTMPAKQLALGRELVAYLRQRRPDLPWILHKNAPGNATACPGRYFPWDEIRKGVTVAETVPNADRPRIKNLMVQYLIRAQLDGEPVDVKDCAGFSVLADSWGEPARRLAWRISGRLPETKQTAKPTVELLRALRAAKR